MLGNEYFKINIPAKGVFGNFTGLDIKDNSDIFATILNNSINLAFNNIYPNQDFSNIIDENVNDDIKDISEFLWNRFNGDNLKNFGSTERIQLYSILAYGKDYNSFANIEKNISNDDIETSFKISNDYFNMEKLSIYHENNVTVNTKISNAIHFILALPYNLYEEGI